MDDLSHRLAGPRALLGLIFSCLLMSYLLGIIATGHFVPEAVLGRDAYYHARLAERAPYLRLAREFPWTQVSTWKDRYCDKEFLFHLLMVPFARDRRDPIQGVRWFGLMASMAVLVTLGLVLWRNGAKRPLLFAALPACMGGIFLARLAMIRSHLFSMTLVLVGLHFLFSRRWRGLLLVGFIFSWSYTVPAVLVMVSLPFVIGRYLRSGQLDWRSPSAAAAGVLLGLAFHPFSPNTFETLLTYIQVMHAALLGAQRAKIELGGEIYPLSLRDLVTYYPLLLASAIGLTAVSLRFWRRLTPDGAGAVLAALTWMAMTLLFARFAEYSVLFICAAIALVTRDLALHATSSEPTESASSPPAEGLTRRRVVWAIVVALLAASHIQSIRHFYDYISHSGKPRFRGAALWMERHLPEGAPVLNLYWDDFPELFYHAYRQRYIWGLDPTYTIRYDAQLAKWLEGMRARRLPLDGPGIIQRLGTRTLILRRGRVGRYRELTKGKFPLVYLDEDSAIYDLTAASSCRRLHKCRPACSSRCTGTK